MSSLAEGRRHLHAMLDAIGRIRGYVSGLTYDDFLADRRTFDAIAYNFVIIGEASKHVPERLRRHYTDAPWRVLGDLRNKLAHDCLDVQPFILWNTVVTRLDGLEAALQRMAEV